MGYRTSIKNINAVGHLVEGNVVTFLQQATSSQEMMQTTIDFLDRLIRNTSEQFYMSDEYWRNLKPDLRELRYDWERVREDFKHLGRNDNHRNDESFKKYIRQNARLLDYLKRVSSLFSRCKIKAILLPGFDGNDDINRIMINERVLEEIVHIHPGDTALIMQFTENFNREDKAILNVFSKFETALNRIDEWAGVLLWNDNDSLFIPIREESELYDVFQIIRYEDNSFSYIKNYFERKKKKERKFAYLFHISDLHFGNKLAERRLLRVVRILESKLNSLDESAIAIPIITGDLMNTPNDTNKQTYLQFSELLLTKGFEKPVYILGNHDIDTSGFIKLLSKHKAVIASLSSSTKIELIEELNLGIIKFNSNTGGEFAQGKIGTDQLMEIGNEIDAINDNEKYTFIAILHHHPIEIDNPSWYARDWYEALLGRNNYEKTMKLTDSDLFLEWIESRNIKLIMHGHKHIPKVQNHKDVTVVAAGSTTGSVNHIEKGKTFLTYNLIKYDIDAKRPVSCSIIAEEILGAGTKNMLLHLM